MEVNKMAIRTIKSEGTIMAVLLAAHLIVLKYLYMD
jgi:hypothetical protein